MNVVHSEWLKLRSVRSTWLTLSISAAATLVLGGYASHAAVSGGGDFDAVQTSLGALLIVQLAFGVFGALAITSEYATGTIRTTLTAVPGRRTVLAAKAAVTGVVAIVAGEAIAFGTFFVGQAMLARRHLDVTLGEPGVLRAVLGGGFYLFIMAMVGLGLGTIIRHTAGAIAAVGLVLIEPLLIRLVFPAPSPVGNYVLWWAAQSLTSAGPRPGYPPATDALIVCIAYPAILLTVAAVLIHRRDA